MYWMTLTPLSARASESEVKIIDAFDWSVPKTKQAKALLEAIGAGRKILLVLGSSDAIAELSFRNLPNVLTCDSGHVTTYDVLWAETIVFTSETLGSITGLEKFDVAKDDFVKESSSSESSKNSEKSSSGDSDSASSAGAEEVKEDSEAESSSPDGSDVGGEG